MLDRLVKEVENNSNIEQVRLGNKSQLIFYNSWCIRELMEKFEKVKKS
ncbi:MAG: hypothetical protein WC523_04125 [Patescibacteria group bacterium]